jgi:hypothetical protein
MFSVIASTVAGLIVLSGCLPLEWMRYQDYEVARQILQWDAPFRPNLRLHTKFFLGDEADEGNLRPTEELPARNFTTDRLGFRDTPPILPGKVADLVVFRGFSFTFGAGLSDDQTLPSVLERELRVNAYNAGRFHDDPETPEDFDALMGRIGAHPHTVVYVHLEPNGHVGVERPQHLKRLLRFAKELPMNWIRSSPAIRYAGLAKKQAENDRVLHNRYADHVVSYPLPDGRRFLVLDRELEHDVTEYDDAVVAERADYIAWWNARMTERGAQMVVLLVPDKLSVYGPELGVPLPREPYLNRMEKQLEERGLRVVNGLSLLRATARQDLASGRLAYLREDQHWSASGVERLGKATAEAIRGVNDGRAPAMSRARQ